MIKVIKDKKKEINLDDGLFFAKSVFETILITDRPIFLKEHIDRLIGSIKKLKINRTITLQEVMSFIKDNNVKNCVLKVVVTDTNTIFTTRENKYTVDDYKKGFSLSVSDVIRNSTSMITYIKTTSYIENIMEKEKAIKNGFDDMLFLNENKYIAECTSSNIFWIKDNKIYTPDAKCGILPGIIRGWILKNFEVNLGFYKLEDILDADEIFITNSVIGILKINKLKNKNFKCNDIIDKITLKYLNLVEVN